MGILRRQGYGAENAGWFAPKKTVADRVTSSRADKLDLLPEVHGTDNEELVNAIYDGSESVSGIYDQLDADTLSDVVQWFKLNDKHDDLEKRLDTHIEPDDVFETTRADLIGMRARVQIDMDKIREELSEAIENGTWDTERDCRYVHQRNTRLMLEAWHKDPVTRIVIEGIVNEGIAIQRSE